MKNYKILKTGFFKTRSIDLATFEKNGSMLLAVDFFKKTVEQ